MFRYFNRLFSNRDASALAEFSLVLPVLITLLVGTIEAGLLFQLKNNMTYHTRNVARDVALGNLTGAEATTELTRLLNTYADLSYTVKIAVPDPDVEADTDVVVTVTLPQADVESYALTGLLVTGDFSSSATMRSLE